MTRMLIGAALLGALALSCEPTTYGQAVQQQKRESALQREDDTTRATECPTIAAEGSRDYSRCQARLEGTGP